jgi:hypothetical protein
MLAKCANLSANLGDAFGRTDVWPLVTVEDVEVGGHALRVHLAQLALKLSERAREKKQCPIKTQRGTKQRKDDDEIFSITACLSKYLDAVWAVGRAFEEKCHGRCARERTKKDGQSLSWGRKVLIL